MESVLSKAHVWPFAASTMNFPEAHERTRQSEFRTDRQSSDLAILFSTAKSGRKVHRSSGKKIWTANRGRASRTGSAGPQ
jgi:hypothetical protein